MSTILTAKVIVVNHHHDLLWMSVLAHRLFEKTGRSHRIAPGTDQEIDGSTSLSTARYSYLHWPLILM